jgi:transcriptional regulator with XRE-family HTH domain
VELGQRILALRELRNMTQEDVARAIGKTDGYIGQIEKGIANPTLRVLEDIAGALGVELVVMLSEPTSAQLPRERRELVERVQRALLHVPAEDVSDFGSMVSLLERRAVTAAEAADAG